MSENGNKNEKPLFPWISDEMIFCEKNRENEEFKTSNQTKAHCPLVPLENATSPIHYQM